MMAGRVPYGERYWQTPLKQTAPLGPQDVKFGSVACCTQPLSRTHVEAVQGLVSAQFGGGPPTQTPRMQESPVVHRLPSSHEAPLGKVIGRVTWNGPPELMLEPSFRMGSLENSRPTLAPFSSLARSPTASPSTGHDAPLPTIRMPSTSVATALPPSTSAPLPSLICELVMTA